MNQTSRIASRSKLIKQLIRSEGIKGWYRIRKQQLSRDKNLQGLRIARQLRLVSQGKITVKGRQILNFLVYTYTDLPYNLKKPKSFNYKKADNELRRYKLIITNRYSDGGPRGNDGNLTSKGKILFDSLVWNFTHLPLTKPLSNTG